MDKKSKCKTRKYKTPRGEHRQFTNSELIYSLVEIVKIRIMKKKLAKKSLVECEEVCAD